MAADTRERIVETARQLFNEQRFGKVTLLALATHLGMAKGNLWYHFHDKSALLAAITERYLERVAERERLGPEPGQSLASYVAFLRVLIAEMADYRFMYRDQTDYGEHSEALRTALPAILDRVLGQFSAFYGAMIQEGHLDMPPRMLEAAGLNAGLVLRYFLEFARERGLPDGPAEDAVRAAIAQHLTLLEGRLTPGAFEYLHAQLGANPIHQGVL